MLFTKDDSPALKDFGTFLVPRVYLRYKKSPPFLKDAIQGEGKSCDRNKQNTPVHLQINP